MDTSGLIYLLNRYLAPVGDEVPGGLCRNQSLDYRDSLKLGASWATKMWDSTAKIQTGLLTGNLNSLGNYDECLSIGEIADHYGNFTGRYCMATLKLGNVTARDALGNMLKEVMDEEGEINIGLGAILAKGLRWGFCIPSSCSSTDLAMGLSEAIGNETGMMVSVKDSDCSDTSPQPFTIVDWVAIALFILFLCASLVGTGYDIFTAYRKYGRFGTAGTPSEYSASLTTNKTGSTSLTPDMPAPARPPSAELSRTSSIVDVNCSGQSLPRPKFLPLIRVNKPAAARTPSPAEHVVHEESCSMSCSSSSSTFVMPTVSPVVDPPEKEYDVLACFSLVGNLIKLFRFAEPKIILKSVDGVKVLSLCWVVLGHACFITESLPAINYISIRMYVQQWPAMLILNTQLAADTFLVCSGALISFTFLKDMRKRGIYRRHCNRLERTGMTKCFLFRYLPMFYFHRYIRFTPALAVILLLQVSLLNHMGSGPFWGSGNGYLTDVCRDSWWGTLLYIENYISADRICLPHSWYIMVEMQLYNVAPLILLAFLCYTKRRSLIIVSVLVLLGVLVSFLVNFLLELPSGFLRDSSKWIKKMKYDYVATHTRFAPWLIGMTLGYLIFNYKRRETVNPTMSKTLIYTGWVLAPLFMLYSLFGLAAYQHLDDNDKYYHLWGAMYSGIFHSLWALGIAWIIFTSETNHGGIAQCILSLKIFRPLSRLSYCFYLVHLPLMTYQALTIRVPVHLSGNAGISLFFGDLLFSLLLAVLLSLLVEMPFVRLYRAICIHMNLAVRYAPPRPNRKLLAQYAPLIEELKRARSRADVPGQPQPAASSFMDTIRFINEPGSSLVSMKAPQSSQQDDLSSSVQRMQNRPKEPLPGASEKQSPVSTTTSNETIYEKIPNGDISPDEAIYEKVLPRDDP